jgi:hypothetical protein
MVTGSLSDSFPDIWDADKFPIPDSCPVFGNYLATTGALHELEYLCPHGNFYSNVFDEEKFVPPPHEINQTPRYFSISSISRVFQSHADVAGQIGVYYLPICFSANLARILFLNYPEQYRRHPNYPEPSGFFWNVTTLNSTRIQRKCNGTRRNEKESI